MADLSTYALVDAELAATADYDFPGDVDKAQRRVAALRRKLDFASAGAQSGSSVQFQLNIVQDQLNACIAWLKANGASPSDEQLLRNPSVVHFDQSRFRGYTPDPVPGNGAGT